MSGVYPACLFSCQLFSLHLLKHHRPQRSNMWIVFAEISFTHLSHSAFIKNVYVISIFVSDYFYCHCPNGKHFWNFLRSNRMERYVEYYHRFIPFEHKLTSFDFFLFFFVNTEKTFSPFLRMNMFLKEFFFKKNMVHTIWVMRYKKPTYPVNVLKFPIRRGKKNTTKYLESWQKFQSQSMWLIAAHNISPSGTVWMMHS